MDAVQISAFYLLICTVLFIYPASSTSACLQAMRQRVAAAAPQNEINGFDSLCMYPTKTDGGLA
jgi:hypothetical protein